MSKQTAASFFILPLSEAKSAALYQALLGGIGSYQQLGERLIHLAEQAYALRHFGEVKEMGLMLSNIPIKRYQAIGHYYLAVAANSKGNGNQDEAKRLFELVIDTAPDDYKVKGVLSLGALAYNRRDFDSALYFYRQTIKAGRLSIASMQAIRGLGILKAIEDDHEQALKDLESILPVMKYAPAHIYFDLLNSYAVELGEVGRKNEARNISRHVLASPFVHAYPEWRETAKDLRPPRRSFVALSSTHYNIPSLPEREPIEEPSLEFNPARVFNFAKLKQKIVKEKHDKNRARQLDHMSLRDLGFKLLEIITQYRPTKRQLRAIIDFALHLLSYPTDPDQPDKPSA